MYGWLSSIQNMRNKRYEQVCQLNGAKRMTSLMHTIRKSYMYIFGIYLMQSPDTCKNAPPGIRSHKAHPSAHTCLDSQRLMQQDTIHRSKQCQSINVIRSRPDARASETLQLGAGRWPPIRHEGLARRHAVRPPHCGGARGPPTSGAAAATARGRPPHRRPAGSRSGGSPPRAPAAPPGCAP